MSIIVIIIIIIKMRRAFQKKIIYNYKKRIFLLLFFSISTFIMTIQHKIENIIYNIVKTTNNFSYLSFLLLLVFFISFQFKPVKSVSSIYIYILEIKIRVYIDI